MPSRRAATTLAALLALGLSGCRAVGLSQVRPEAAAPVPTLAVAEMMAQHNRNAELVQALEAQPPVSDRRIGAASGRMALVRPRDFKLTLGTPTRGVIADLGSNEQEFWLWSSQSEEKAIYVGQYGAGGQVQPEFAFQPDWVVEALGLRVIPPEEVRSITTREGDAPGTLVLVHRRPTATGSTSVKATVVDRATGRVREHDFYAPDGKTLVARAFPEDYQAVRLASGESVQLPDRIRLLVMDAQQEPTAYTIVLGCSSVRVNQFDEARRAVVFSRPDYDGYAVVDLRDRLADPGQQASASYNTLPPGEAPAAVRLSEPAPLGSEATQRLPEDPVPLTADLPAPVDAAGTIDVVGARLPRPPGVSSVGVQQSPQALGVGFGIPASR